MLETGELRHMREWVAYSIIKASVQNPEPTQWDDPLTLQRKATARAQRANAAALAQRQTKGRR